MPRNGGASAQVEVHGKSGDGERKALVPSPMHIGRWMDEMRRDFESWMGTSFGWPRVGAFSEAWQLPRADVSDAGDHYEVLADIPGIPKDGIEITAGRGLLEVRAEAAAETEGRHKDYYHREIGRRAYYRSLPLPDDADTENAAARLEDGCLMIDVPKKGHATQGKKIPLA